MGGRDHPPRGPDREPCTLILPRVAEGAARLSVELVDSDGRPLEPRSLRLLRFGDDPNPQSHPAKGVIGEVTAAGFRLAGVEAHVAFPREAGALFRRLRDEAELLIVTAEVAAAVPAELLQQTADRGRPLLLVVPDAAGRRQPEDLASKLRQQLGMAE